MFNRKTISLSILGILMIGPSLSLADHDRDYDRQARYDRGRTDYARVIDVDPIVRYVRVKTPHRVCWDEVRYDRSHRSHRSHRVSTTGSTIVGGIIGGVIGRQFGGGNGRDAMTVVGTLVGSAIGHENAERRNWRRGHDYYEPVGRTVERCRTDYEYEERERIDGYKVTYLYNGRTYKTRTNRHPGEEIRVKVSVSPVG